MWEVGQGEGTWKIPVVINNNNVNVFSNADSDSSEDDFKNDDGNFFDEDIDNQVKATTQTTIDAKVLSFI